MYVLSNSYVLLKAVINILISVLILFLDMILAPHHPMLAITEHCHELSSEVK